MKIGIAFFGILYGYKDREGVSRDYRHCWPNIRENIIDPLEKEGHLVSIYFSTYDFENTILTDEFLESLKPTKVILCKYEGSDQYTTKSALFTAFEDDHLDTILWTRTDIHFMKHISTWNIQYNKFNFLFREKDHWENGLQYTTDNMYIWPHHMTRIVKDAMLETIEYEKSIGRKDTHALFGFLSRHLDSTSIHIICPTDQFSHDNNYYTLCRFLTKQVDPCANTHTHR